MILDIPSLHVVASPVFRTEIQFNADVFVVFIVAVVFAVVSM